MPRAGDDDKQFDEMLERHRRIARRMQANVALRLQRLVPNELRPEVTARWFDVSTRIEREIRESASSDEGDVRREFFDRLLADPEASELANRLVARLASRGVVAGRA